MTLEAQLWREVCQHMELEEAVSRVRSILGEHLPVEALVVRRIEREPMRLTTIAVGASHGEKRKQGWKARSKLDRATFKRLTQLRKDIPTLFERGKSPLADALVPNDVEGIVLGFPLTIGKDVVGTALLVLHSDAQVGPSELEVVAQAIVPLAVAFENDQRIHELTRMREALEADRDALLTRLQRTDLSAPVIGESGGLATVMERVKQVAPTDAPVLILGETGSGKEVIARSIHAFSGRRAGPVVRVNCGAIPTELVDSELFGHERGSFTGAINTRKGWFERADGGTLFLDEVGELPLAAQVRLLRVLQDGTLERVGGNHTISVDVRIVAATHRHLETMVAAGTFREDLWYRLSVFPVRLPALRERFEDLPALAAHFAERAGRRLGGSGLAPSASDIELLRRYPWPGNIRELSAVIERAAILGSGKRLEIQAALGSGPSASSSIPPESPAQPTPDTTPANIVTLDEAMATHIRLALRACHGRIEGPFGAAKVLGINPHTLRARMRKLGVEWSQFRGIQSPESTDLA